MRFNKYIWNLYKESESGRTIINNWTPLESFSNEKYAIKVRDSTIKNLNNCDLNRYIIDSKVNINQLLFDYLKTKHDFPNDNIRELYTKFIETGISINNFLACPSNEPIFWVVTIKMISEILYDLHPDYFFPYKFDCEFNKLTKICLEFEIPLPKIPKKQDWFKRAFYYIELCDAFYEFRKMNDFSPSEFCAFLYDFAPNNLKEIEDTEMPNPSKVWFVGGNKMNFEYLDNAVKSSIDSWQCNLDTRRGDIIVMYCLTPRSFIHSIWRANSDGFADPFFYYFNVAYLSDPIILEHKITQKDLINNSIWSNNPLVKKNLQGINGYPIKYREYVELLSMLENKGQRITDFPLIKPTTRLETNDLIGERDVEIKLIEPFFLLLGYSPNDWLRQMPVRMGRGERNFPDYCFSAKPKKGEESAKMIIEAKYEIKTQKQLLETYYQTKSYAMRLQSTCFTIAAKEGIWIFQSKNESFKIEDCIHYNWIDIENPDILHELKQLIGKK